VHVEDGSAAIIAALEAPDDVVRGATFNVGSDEQNHTFRQIAEMIRQHVPGVRVRFEPGADREANYRVSFGKIREGLAFRPTRTVDQGIAEIGAAVRTGSIQDYSEVRYSNHKALTQGRADLLLKSDAAVTPVLSE
jgi:nucleoside-diphosphate-sugar epimerase